MEGWKNWVGKNVFIRVKGSHPFQGNVIEVDDSSQHLVWITIIDKFDKRVVFTTEEIISIKEED